MTDITFGDGNLFLIRIVIESVGQNFQCDFFSRPAETNAVETQFVLGKIQRGGCFAEQRPFHRFGGFEDGVAGNVGGAGGVGAGIEGGQIGVGTGDDDLVGRRLQFFRGDLSEDRIALLTDVGGADGQVIEPAVVEFEGREAMSIKGIPLPCMAIAIPTPRTLSAPTGTRGYLFFQSMSSIPRSTQ